MEKSTAGWRGRRKEDENNKENSEHVHPTKRRRKDDIRNYMGEKAREKDAEEESEENKANENVIEDEEDIGEEEREQQEENEMRNEEGESEQNMEQEGATYGAWEEGTFMEEDFWDKYIEKRRLRI